MRFASIRFGGVALACAGIAWVLGGLCGCSELGIGPFDDGKGGSSKSKVKVEPRPVVEITQPARGAFLAAGPALVTGRTAPAVVSGTAVATVTVNGQAATLRPDGTFEAMVTLESGINPIVAAVTDADGLGNNTSLAVMAGEYKPVSQPINEAAALRLNDSALHAIAAILEDVVWTIDLNQLTVAPIASGNLAWIQAWVNIINARFYDVNVSLDMQPDGLHVRIEVIQVVVDLEATVDLGLGITAGPESASAKADKVIVTGRMVLGTDADDKLRLDIADARLGFDGFRIDFTSGLIQLIEAALRTVIQDEISKLASNAIANAKPQIDQGMDDAFTPQAPLNFLGKPFIYDLRGDSVVFDHQGMTAALRFHAPPINATARAQAAPGSLHTDGGLPPMTTGQGVLLTVDDDGVNRLLHTFWANGLLEFDFATNVIPLPGTTTSPTGGLTAFDLMQVLPELQGYLPQSAPIAIRVRADLPPVMKVSGSPDPLELQIGELILEILVDRGNGMEVLAEVAIAGKASANAGMTAQGLWLTSGRNAEFFFDVRSMPIAPIDTRNIQVILGTAIAPLLPRVINQVPVVPIPHLHQLSLVNVQVFPDGPLFEHLSVSGQLQR
jgi:hypothetical protein